MRWLMRWAYTEKCVPKGCNQVCRDGGRLFGGIHFEEGRESVVRDNLEVTVRKEKCSTSRSDLRTGPDGRDALVFVTMGAEPWTYR